MYDVAQCPSINPFIKPYMNGYDSNPREGKLLRKKGRNKQKGEGNEDGNGNEKNNREPHREKPLSHTTFNRDCTYFDPLNPFIE